jgi:hypothetical protein
MLIFGIGTLLSARGVNEHKLGVTYKQSDLHEAELTGFKRRWNAADGDGRYLGLTPAADDKVNGVTFDLPEEHLHRFLDSEGADSDHGKGIYQLTDVTEHITPKPAEKVFTLVTKHPTHEGAVSPAYVRQVASALGTHNMDFQREFHRTTPNARS